MAVRAEVKRSDPRKERARATRRRMVEAAYRLFCEGGYGVPMTAIATEAGVAVQTLYFTFHTKAALLQEALTLAVLGDDIPLAPHERPWFADVIAEPDPRLGLAKIVANTLPIFARAAPLVAVFKTGDSEVAGMWQRSEQLRLDGMTYMTGLLLKKGRVKSGLDLSTAADIVFVLLSPEMYQAFVGERHWEPARWQAWTVDTLSASLFD